MWPVAALEQVGGSMEEMKIVRESQARSRQGLVELGKRLGLCSSIMGIVCTKFYAYEILLYHIPLLALHKLAYVAYPKRINYACNILP